MFYNRKDSNQNLQNSDLFSRSQNIHFVTENMVSGFLRSQNIHFVTENMVSGFSRSQNIHFVTENMHGFGFLGVKKFNKEFREH